MYPGGYKRDEDFSKELNLTKYTVLSTRYWGYMHMGNKKTTGLILWLSIFSLLHRVGCPISSAGP